MSAAALAVCAHLCTNLPASAAPPRNQELESSPLIDALKKRTEENKEVNEARVKSATQKSAASAIAGEGARPREAIQKLQKQLNEQAQAKSMNELKWQKVRIDQITSCAVELAKSLEPSQIPNLVDQITSLVEPSQESTDAAMNSKIDAAHSTSAGSSGSAGESPPGAGSPPIDS